MTDHMKHDAKGGNRGGSRTSESLRDGARSPDNSGREPNDEGADPTSDIKKQNPGEKTSSDLADELAPDDPHKVEKLAKAGRKDFDPDDGAE